MSRESKRARLALQSLEQKLEQESILSTNLEVLDYAVKQELREAVVELGQRALESDKARKVLSLCPLEVTAYTTTLDRTRFRLLEDDVEVLDDAELVTVVSEDSVRIDKSELVIEEKYVGQEKLERLGLVDLI